jgi:hypothetical protein
MENLDMTGWQRMITAPRDGSEILIAVESRAGIPGKMLVGHYMPGGHCIEDHPAIDEGWYFWNGSMFDKASKPLWWMPLPEPPTGKMTLEEAKQKNRCRVCGGEFAVPWRLDFGKEFAHEACAVNAT